MGKAPYPNRKAALDALTERTNGTGYASTADYVGDDGTLRWMGVMNNPTTGEAAVYHEGDVAEDGTVP